MRDTRHLRVIATSLLVICGHVLGAAQDWHAPEVSTHAFTHRDGVEATYYRARFGEGASSDVFMFTYGGSGCVSWRDYVGRYFDGLRGRITVFALNKRHVSDQVPGHGCSRAFMADNHPRQWVSDYMAFISKQLKEAPTPPRRVALLGISEGAYVAAAVARSRDDITDLAIIGDGAWTMRRALEESEGLAAADAWREIAKDPNSLEKQWMGHPYRWWFDVMDLDSTPHYLSLGIPILLGFGDKDESVPVGSALALQTAFERAGKRNLTLRIYKGADHTLMAGSMNVRAEFFGELSRRLER